MPRGRASGYPEQRAAILAASARLFALHGFAATSMNQVAQACGLSKPALYHYFADKDALLAEIAESHVRQLLAVVRAVESECTDAADRLPALIRHFVEEYAGAQDAHRVLTEDVRFLDVARRTRILDIEREVVAGFAAAIAALRPGLAQRAKPLAMLLFGMINWLFTWFKPGRDLDYAELAPLVAELFLHGALNLTTH